MKSIRAVLLWTFITSNIISCNLPGNNPDELLRYVWTGAVTDSSAVVALKIDAEAQVRVIYSADRTFDKDKKLSAPVKVTRKDYLTAKIPLDSLLAGTQYYYKIEIDGEVMESQDLAGKFKTFPSSASSFKIAFASCARTGSRSRIFRTIMNLEPLFYMNVGDLHYENIHENCEYDFAEAMFDIQRSPSQSTLYHNIPFTYIWDDHDYGPNNSAEDASCRKEAIEAFKRFIPHYPLAFDKNNGPVSQTFNVGRVKFVLTDLRSQKKRPKYNGCEKTKEGSNFGFDKHLDWFKDQLMQAKNDSMLVAWVSGIPWISDERSRKHECDEDDDWGGFQEERQEIADFIKSNDIPLFILSGDAHMVAIDDGTNSDYATGGGLEVPVFHAAPLDNFGIYKGGPYSMGYSAKNGQFGLMEVVDNGGAEICIQWTALDKYGNGVNNSLGQPIAYRFCREVY